jgi:hypothetical protein
MNEDIIKVIENPQDLELDEGSTAILILYPFYVILV